MRSSWCSTMRATDAPPPVAPTPHPPPQQVVWHAATGYPLPMQYARYPAPGHMPPPPGWHAPHGQALPPPPPPPYGWNMVPGYGYVPAMPAMPPTYVAIADADELPELGPDEDAGALMEAFRRPPRYRTPENVRTEGAEDVGGAGDDEEYDEAVEDVDVDGAVAAGRAPRLSQAAKNELRLRGALRDLGFGEDDGDGEHEPAAVPKQSSKDLLQDALRACAQINGFVGQQSADRRFRFAGHQMAAGREADSGVLYSVGDLVAVVFQSDTACFFDVGVIKQIGVASRRGKPNHARGLVIRRDTVGARVTVFFHERVRARGGEPSVVICGTSYLACADGRTVFSPIDAAAQTPDSYPANALLCPLGTMEPSPTGGDDVVLTAQDAAKVDGLLARLAAGEDISLVAEA